MSLSERVILRKSGAQRVRFVQMPLSTTDHGGALQGSHMAPTRSSGGEHRSPGDGWLPLGETVAQTEAARLEREYRRGFEEGRKGSVEESRLRLIEQERIAQEHITELLATIQSQFQALMTRIEVDAMRFAIAVAERIVRREVTLDDEVVIRQIQDAVRRVVGTDTIKLRIHPDDELVVRGHRGALLALSNSIRDAVIESDSTIERGGCIIESPAGNVDARLATQLRQIESALFGALPQDEGGNR